MVVAQLQACRPEVRMALIQKTRIQNSDTTELRSSEIQQDQSQVVWVRGLVVSQTQTVTGSDPGAAPPSNLDLCLCLKVRSTVGLVSESRISSTHSVPGPQSGSGSRTPTTRTRIQSTNTRTQTTRTRTPTTRTRIQSTRTRTPTTRTRRRNKVPPSVFKGRGEFNPSEANPTGSPDQQKVTCPPTGRLQMSVCPEASQLVLYSK